MKKIINLGEKSKENLKVLGAAIGGIVLASVMHIEFAIATLVLIVAFIATKMLNTKLRIVIVLVVAILVTIASVVFHSKYCLKKNEVADNNVPQITEETTQEEVEDQPEEEVVEEAKEETVSTETSSTRLCLQ